MEVAKRMVDLGMLTEGHDDGAVAIVHSGNGVADEGERCSADLGCDAVGLVDKEGDRDAIGGLHDARSAGANDQQRDYEQPDAERQPAAVGRQVAPANVVQQHEVRQDQQAKQR
jgi:hypothetical protein